jgi:hypothetical protein
LNIEQWTENVAEAKTLRREISRIAADYDIEWKGDLENLETLGEGNRLEDIERGGNGGRNKKSLESSGSETKTPANGSISKSEDGKERGKLDIDATINEASDLAEQTEHQRSKEQAAQRKGESVEGEGNSDGRGLGSRERMEREKEGRERGKRIVGKNQERFE